MRATHLVIGSLGATVLLALAAHAASPAFDSGNLQGGGMYSWHSTETGTFSYKCTIHGFTATIVVQEGDGMGRTAQVAIQSGRFEPAQVTILKGGDVRWTNADGAPHTATATVDAMGKDTMMGPKAAPGPAPALALGLLGMVAWAAKRRA